MAYEDALAIEDSNQRDNDDKDLAGLPVDSVEDRVSHLHLNSASNTQTVVGDKFPVGKEWQCDDNGEIKLNIKPETRKPRGKNTLRSPSATGSPGEPHVKLQYSSQIIKTDTVSLEFSGKIMRFILHTVFPLKCAFSLPNVEPRIFWSTETTVIPKSTLGKGK